MRRRSFPEAALPAHADFFSDFFSLNPLMRAAVNDHGWDISFIQYSHYGVREELFISVKFDNVIKVLVRTAYGNIRV
jgi:hypothetical protein